ELFSRHRSEFESGGRAVHDRGVIRIDHRILEPADAGYHGNRAVSERAKLRQAARLEPRGHCERIAARLDKMRERFVVADHDADLSRMSLGGRTETVLQIGVAASKQGQLHSLAYHHRQRFEEEIEPLLPGKPADDAEQKSLR